MGSPYVEYPRGGGPGSGGPFRGTPRGAVDFAAIGEAWELLKGNMAPFAIATLIAGVVIYAVTFIMMIPMIGMQIAATQGGQDPTALIMATIPLRILIQLVTNLLIGVMLGGFAHMTLALLRGEAVTVGHFFRVMPKIHIFLLYGLLYGIFTTLGIVACCVGSLVVAGLLMFSPLFMVDKELGAWEAITASVNALKGEWLMASVFYLVASLVAAVGMIACGVGILVTAPLAMLAVAIVYRDVVYVGVNSAPVGPTDPPSTPGGMSGDAPSNPPADGQ